MSKTIMSEQLLNWYDQTARDLPWRSTHTPYAVWISEIMLQQTQVATVIDYYNRFMEKFPDVYALAAADEESVFKMWEGLGYYSRARNLMRAARIIADRHAGEFPQSKAELIKLPGIGPYTAGAIASIAFNEPVPAVDGNVLRVMSRLYAVSLDIGLSKNRSHFETLVMNQMPSRAGDFNQALMELGARVCTPKSPKCTECPVQEHCMAYKAGAPEKYPVKMPKPPKKIQEVSVLILNHDNRIAIVKRPEGGLMSGLWGFPVVIDDASEAGHKAYFEREFGFSTIRRGIGGTAKHVFTHLVWQMQIYEYVFKDDTLPPETIDDPEMLWVSRSEIEAFAFPTAFKKLFKQIAFLRKDG